MNLLDLPQEILIKILRRLDTKSLFGVYNTCIYMKNFLSMHGVVKVCKFSLSSLAKPDSLKSTFFGDIAGYLIKLDVSCMPNLNKMILLNVAPKLNTLKILDVSYTLINIMDLIAIHQLCPTINDICINFDFGRTSWIRIPKEKLKEYQILFKKFKNVHFVGNFESLYFSNLSLAILQSAKIDKLQLTITDCNLPVYEHSEAYEKMFKYNQIIVYLLNWKNKQESHTDFDNFFLTSALNANKCEFIVIVWLNIIYRAVYVSPLFLEFFKKKFNIQAECLTELTPKVLGGNAVLMVWKKGSTVFDEAFYNSLFNQLTAFFPHHHETLYGTSVLPAACDWLYVTQLQGLEAGTPDPETHLYNQVLDFDSMTMEKKSLKLSIQFQHMSLESYAKLPPHALYLKKLTYIDLNGLMCYREDFFSVLFTCCTKLETFHMTFDDYISSAIHDVTETLPMSKSLKNFRLVSPCLELQSIFVCLSKCTNLENIHLVDKFSDPQPVSFSRAIFENCPNLYNYSIAMEMTPDVLKRKLHILHNLRLEYGRQHLNIELYCAGMYNEYSYDPFISVFNLCPLKPH